MAAYRGSFPSIAGGETMYSDRKNQENKETNSEFTTIERLNEE